MVLAVELKDVSFSFATSSRPTLCRVSLAVERGARLVLVGANGAGKSTLLNLIGGKRMAGGGTAKVLGHDSFEHTALALSISNITTDWEDDLTLPVKKLVLSAADGCERQRVQLLLEALGVAELLPYELSQLSDGQRRRVQLFCKLCPARDVILLDEATNSLDVLSRAKLLAFLRAESEERGATVLFCTHIFDGLDGWATSVAHLDGGVLHRHVAAADLPEGRSLYQVRGRTCGRRAQPPCSRRAAAVGLQPHHRRRGCACLNNRRVAAV